MNESKFDPKFTLIAVMIVGLVIALLYATKKPKHSFSQELAPQDQKAVDKIREDIPEFGKIGP